MKLEVGKTYLFKHGHGESVEANKPVVVTKLRENSIMINIQLEGGIEGLAFPDELHPMPSPFVTKAELLRFIKVQRNDRKVNMTEGSKLHPTGCVLNHLARSRKIPFEYATFRKVMAGEKCLLYIEHDGDVRDLFNWHKVDFIDNITYGELKKHLLTVE